MSELKFWNTLTRVKEEFQPIDKDNVRMYVCGPTVYDFAHIGNARPVIVFDVLFRLLRHVYGADHVTYVRNITDVDDKINARALRDYPDLPLNEAIAKVTEKTANRFHKDAAALGCLEPTHEPRATAHIDGMVKMIQTLIDKGNAYVTSGREGREVLFAVSSMPDYGKLSNRKPEDQQAGARIAVEDHKRNPADFVLWKESASDEPGWDGVFADGGQTISIHGRPGWHIECSVMSEHHLGATFDIHGGGLDLIFPHHENEIAQSCCAHGNDRMANLWMHNGFLQVEGKKMSKSDGNFVTIAELLETDKFGGRKWPGEVLRLAMLMTHYREPIDFSVKRLEEANISLSNWLGPHARRGVPEDGSVSKEVVRALSDDLDFSAAKLVIDFMLAESRKVTDLDQESIGKTKLRNDLAATLVWLGLAKQDEDFAVARANKQGLRAVVEAALVGLKASDVDSRVNERLAFIAAKNWAEADRIRDELLAQGIQLKDGKDPETGERVTTWEVKR
ncbi:cysteinyl-tRNA synthetase [Hoeflea phototrophica DFL-43]|uniref:Cysteine--tRNA ligase n=1 Tax=Hoeflea phototrophica (strain DSM 17068 / NCIMB 14078 / DFL-43) TaxID=411684 RepID=A9DBA4_HOEPD|nr:cysteine--tRNA ligase [Hoeflea phototrophica]EDQ32473.1 cysteinyl-tRNA synthetase [Hoeflea phototrophica DFL-43]